jgi:hypothetical protein
MPLLGLENMQVCQKMLPYQFKSAKINYSRFPNDNGDQTADGPANGLACGKTQKASKGCPHPLEASTSGFGTTLLIRLPPLDVNSEIIQPLHH